MEASNKRDLDPPKRSRRTFSRAFKAELVARAERGDTSVSRLAIENGINTNQLRKWITNSDAALIISRLGVAGRSRR